MGSGFDQDEADRYAVEKVTPIFDAIGTLGSVEELAGSMHAAASVLSRMYLEFVEMPCSVAILSDLTAAVMRSMVQWSDTESN